MLWLGPNATSDEAAVDSGCSGTRRDKLNARGRQSPGWPPTTCAPACRPVRRIQWATMLVRIGGQSYPYVRKSRAEARRTAAALTTACGFPVEIQPVLAFVAVARLQVVPSLRDVRVHQERDISALKHLKTDWRPDKAEAAYEAARDRRTWIRS
ncbi:hypothetical protein [Streptomyces sp. NPDC087317]|uniref:hypothetical protein n=2 Tax=Streptomyces TaxID=1883 RepID=UPI0037FC4AC3